MLLGVHMSSRFPCTIALLLAPLCAQDPQLVLAQVPGALPIFGLPLLGRSGGPGELLVGLTGDARGNELWRTDGAPSGTSFVRELVPGLSSPMFLGAGSDAAGSVILLDRGFGHEFWRSDGTAAGTSLMFRAADIFVRQMEPPQLPFRIGSQWLFNADGRMWISDGTVGGTSPLGPISGFVVSTYAGRFHVIGHDQRAYAITPFSVPLIWSQQNASWSLHRDEPILVQQVPGPTTWPPASTTFTAVYRASQPSVTFPGAAYFVTLRDGIAIVAPPTLAHWDFASTPVTLSSTAGGAVLGLGDRLLFSATDATHGSEPWITDGTTAGTLPLDLTPGPASSLCSFVGSSPGGNYAVLWRTEAQTGAEPWVTDGTVAGTRLLQDLEPGPGSSQVDSWSGLGSAFTQERFVAPVLTSARGWELWTSDGTPQGSRHLAEIAPGPANGLPQYSWFPMFAGHRVVFFGGPGSLAGNFDLYSVDLGGSTVRYLTQGSRRFSVRGDAVLGSSISLEANGMNATDLGAVAIGLPAAASPIGANDTWLCVDLLRSLPYLPFAPNAQGAWSQSVLVPNSASLQGLSLMAQAGFAGPAIGSGVELGAAWWMSLGN